LVLENGRMWIDERGSEVLPLSECRRLLALAAKEHRHGHLGIPTDDAPLVLPLDFGMHDDHVILQVGEGLFGRVHGQLVAFQVDNSTVGPSWSDVDPEGRWSVLVRGPATEVEVGSVSDDLPEPRIAEPGHRIVRVRADVVTGRRIRTSYVPSDGSWR
jgi:nitroimidazol reductase NimA-like FMN-containing flavoprotein (pyridoxamine 5'-phosphate oxidase superfamily)